MKGIIIVALNEVGTGALQQHIKDKKKSSAKDRFVYKQTFKEVLSEENGLLRLKLLGKHRLLSPESMKSIASEMMIDNGAVSGEDFLIHFVEEDL